MDLFSAMIGAAQALVSIGMKLHDLSEAFDGAKEQSGMVIARLDMLADKMSNETSKLKTATEEVKQKIDQTEKEKELKKQNNEDLAIVEEELKKLKKLAEEKQQDWDNFKSLEKYLGERAEQINTMMEKFNHSEEKSFIMKKLKEAKNRFIDCKAFTELLDQIDKDLERISQCFQSTGMVKLAQALDLVLEESKHMNKTLDDMKDMLATAFTNETISAISEFELQVWWYKNFKAEPIVTWKLFAIALETYMTKHLEENLKDAKKWTIDLQKYFDTDGDGNVDVNEIRLALGDDPITKRQSIKFRTYLQEKISIIKKDTPNN